MFSICAFATTTSYTGFVNFKCISPYKYNYDYPFNLNLINQKLDNGVNCTTAVTINGNFSSDAKFFVATGVLAMLYTIAIIILYIKFDNLYKNNNQVPLVVS